MATRQQRNHSIWSLLGLSLLLGISLVVLAARPLYATDFRGGDTITIGENEVIDDDLFISGDVVTVNGTVKGNLFASGGAITINGHVEGSLFGAGRTLLLNGQVDGSAYVGGYALALGDGAQIGRNLNFGGFSLTTEGGSAIGRSLYGGGYQFLLNGAIENDVAVGSGALELNGTVGGDVRGSVGSPGEGTPAIYMPEFEGAVTAVEPGLRVSEGAKIGGNLTIEQMAASSQAEAAPFYSPANLQLRWAIGEALALLIIGLLFLYMRPTFLQRSGDAVQHDLFASLGIGSLIIFIAVVAVPVALGLLVALAVIGGWLTLGNLVGDIVGLGLVTLLFAIGLFFFTAGMITKIVVAYTGGRLLVGRLVNGDEPMRGGSAIFALVLGVIIYIGLRSIQFGIGSIVGLLVTMVGLGALYLVIRGRGHGAPVVLTERQAAIKSVEAA